MSDLNTHHFPGPTNSTMRTYSKGIYWTCISHWDYTLVLFQILGGASTAFIVEESVVDPSLKTFTTYSRNLTLTRLSLVEEKCEYFMSPDDPSM